MRRRALVAIVTGLGVAAVVAGVLVLSDGSDSLRRDRGAAPTAVEAQPTKERDQQAEANARRAAEQYLQEQVALEQEKVKELQRGANEIADHQP